MHQNCFVNSAAQSLFSFPLFRAYMEILPCNSVTTSGWKDVCRRLNARETHFPGQLCRSWWNEIRKKGRQHDVSEFMIDTLNDLLDEVMELEVIFFNRN